MARYRGPRLRLARREGVDLMLISAVRSVDSKCNMKKAPGQHGMQFKKQSEYGVQFREKQRVKRIYGILERQFLRYYEEAKRQKGNTANNILMLLERRLDNVVYRMGFASTRAEARQMVSHRLIMVDGRVCNFPSFLLVEGQMVAVKEKAKSHVRVQNAVNIAQQIEPTLWVEVDYKKMEGQFVRCPDRSELPSDINENLIVELYSK